MQTLWAASYPTDTSQYYEAGNIVINNAPSAGQPYGWVCVTAGYAGTWYPIVLTPQNALVSTLTGGTYGNGNRVILASISTAGGTNMLPQAAKHAAGFVLTIINNAATALSLTLTPATGESYAAATNITLAQYGVVNLLSNGSTVWYKAA